MFVDLVEYTQRTTQLKREEFSRLHDTFDRLTKPVLQQHQGTIIKKIGDAFLVTFESPTNAVLCGMKLQEKFEEYNQQQQGKEQEGNEKKPLQIRVALDSGEVLIRDNDVYGNPVNIAARVEGITEPDEVYFTEAVYRSINKNEISAIDLGPHELKGVPEAVNIYRVRWQRDVWEHYKTLALEIAMGVILVILAIYFFKLLFSNTTVMKGIGAGLEKIF
jgi:class 3 adenylate cyclase